MKYNSDEIKNSLTFQQVFDYVAELGGNPKLNPVGDDVLIAQTICHNPPGTGSFKLYYYGNTHLFHCWTQCGDSFDIFDLTRKWAKVRGEEWSLVKAVHYVARYFGIAANEEDNFETAQDKLQDWEILRNYNNTSSVNDKKIVEFKEFDDKILAHLPRPRIIPWENEGITQEVMNERGICYDPVNYGIVIPHYDENGKLIGIRERTLIKEEEQYGKYRPAIFNGQMYNHPLGFALYNLNNSKDNIKQMGKAIVFESEKSCLKYASIFGMDNDISVAVCGSNLIQHQLDLLLQYGAKEVVIALDRQYKEIGDIEYQQWVKKLKGLGEKYQKYVKITFIFDVEHNLDYKSSPIDHGKDIFLYLFQNRLDSDGRRF